MNGVVNIDIDKIKFNIADYLYRKIEEADIPHVKEEKQTWQEHDADLQMLFGRKHITLNSKNIEYEERHCLSDYVMSDKVKEKLFYLDWADIEITLTIYRLGQYSYWNACVDYVRAM